LPVCGNGGTESWELFRIEVLASRELKAYSGCENREPENRDTFRILDFGIKICVCFVLLSVVVVLTSLPVDQWS